MRESGFTLDQISEDPDLVSIRERAFARIQVATQEGKVYKSDINRDLAADSLPREVLSFLLSVILLKLSRAQYLIKKFSLQEARGAEFFLESDLRRSSMDTRRLATKIIHDISGVEISESDDHFIINVADYLSRAVYFHAREWKLINRRVESGKVFLTPHETVRLIRQELVNYITAKIHAATTPSMVPGLEDFVAQLKNMEAKFQPRTIVSNKIPPCISHAIDTLKAGKNLSHSGRFMLATYMLGQEYPIPDIIPYFENAPDYNQSITEYQLNHLAGKLGKSTRYTCQSCEKLRSLDLCYAIPECAGISNPLQFGSR